MASGRLVHIGVHVGVATLLAAATITAGGIIRDAGAASPATPSTFVPIVPCRLVDTRPGPDQVGSRSTPIGPADSVTFTVWGTNGNCTVPTTATGIAGNVTIDRPSSSSFLTVFPPDAARPLTSNLNWLPTSPPTPNQVTVALSSSGAIAAYNNSGTVDLIIDIVGYYQPGAPGPTGPAGTAGPAGSPGSPGSAGPRGVSAWDTIPSGQTVTGTVTLDGHSGDNLDGVGIDLPAKAPTALTDQSVNFGAGSGATDQDAACTGTAAVPTAPAGKVCIYFTNTAEFVAGIDKPALEAHAGILTTQSFVVTLTPSDLPDADLYFYGTYAYTAP